MCVAVFLRQIGGDNIENQYYRDNLEQILSFSGGKNLLNVSEVARFTGIVDRRVVKRIYPFVDNRISAATLARCMCGSIKK